MYEGQEQWSSFAACRRFSFMRSPMFDLSSSDIISCPSLQRLPSHPLPTFTLFRFQYPGSDVFANDLTNHENRDIVLVLRSHHVVGRCQEAEMLNIKTSLLQDLASCTVFQ